MSKIVCVGAKRGSGAFQALFRLRFVMHNNGIMLGIGISS
jgi:hypothetical protein